MNLNLRVQSTKLRLSGKTYSDINKALGTDIPKSTFSGWFKELELPAASLQKLEMSINTKLKRARVKALETNRINRQKRMHGLKNKNLHLLKLLNEDVYKLLLCILYLAEGAKSKSTQFLSLASADTRIIKGYLSLLNECFQTDQNKFRVRVQCRNDQNSEELEKYWQEVTKIKHKQFYPTYKDKRTIGVKTLKKDYKGVCTIYYFDRSIQFELEFLADSVLKYLAMGR